MITQSAVFVWTVRHLLSHPCKLVGPGKHLHDRKLLYGAIDGNDFDFFCDLIINQELVRPSARGFQDGKR